MIISNVPLTVTSARMRPISLCDPLLTVSRDQSDCSCLLFPVSRFPTLVSGGSGGPASSPHLISKICLEAILLYLGLLCPFHPLHYFIIIIGNMEIHFEMSIHQSALFLCGEAGAGIISNQESKY